MKQLADRSHTLSWWKWLCDQTPVPSPAGPMRKEEFSGVKTLLALMSPHKPFPRGTHRGLVSLLLVGCRKLAFTPFPPTCGTCQHSQYWCSSLPTSLAIHSLASTIHSMSLTN